MERSNFVVADKSCLLFGGKRWMTWRFAAEGRVLFTAADIDRQENCWLSGLLCVEGSKSISCQ